MSGLFGDNSVDLGGGETTNLNMNDIPLPFSKVSFDEFMSDEFFEKQNKEKQELEEEKKRIEAEEKAKKGDESEEGIEDEGEQGDETQTTDTNDPYKILASFARENNLFDFKDEEYQEGINGEEFIVKKYNEVLDKRVSETVKEIESNYPDEIKHLLENWREGVPLMEMIQSQSRIQELSQLSKEDLDNKDIQKQIVSAFLYEQGYNDSEISKKIEKYEDADMLKDESDMAYSKLIVLEEKYQERLKQEAKERQAKEKENLEKQLKEIETKVMSKKELFTGIPYTDEVKKKVYDAMVKPIAKIGEKQINLITKAQKEDPDFWEKVAYMVVNKWDMSVFQKKAATEQARNLKKTVGTNDLLNLQNGKMKKSFNIDNIRNAVNKLKNNK
jgi:nucleoside diphosphate kinase